MKIIDDFLPDLDIVNRFASTAEYGTHKFMGKEYTGWGSVTLPVKALIEEVMGPVSIRVSYLRKGTRNTPLTHFIHADRAVASKAMVLCLSAPECISGTAFWKHKPTGMIELPFPTPEDTFAMLDADLADPEKWEMIDFVESRENRALFFDSAKFHSRWPKELPIDEGQKPRIVCTVFYDLNADIENWQKSGWNAARPTYDHEIRVSKNDGFGLLNWGECENIHEIHEGNRCLLSDGISFDLDHDSLTALLSGGSEQNRMEACKFIASLGYTPQELHHG